MAIISQTSLPSASADLIVENATCDSGVAVGDWVRWNGSTLVKAVATSLDSANVFGLVESKATSVLATVRVGGISAAVFTGLDVSKEYMLSYQTAGAMTEQGVNVPISAGHVIIMLGKPVDTERFLVRPGIRIVRS